MPENLLKFVCKEYESYVKVKDNRLDGSLGKYEYQFWGTQVDGINLTFMAPSDENTLGRNLGNGSFTGVLGMLHRKEADAHCLATGMLFSPDIVDYIPFPSVCEAKIFQSPYVNAHKLSLLQTINVFNSTTWLLFVLTSFILTIVFKISNRQRAMLMHIFNVGRSFCGQTEIMSTWKPISCIFGLLMVASSFVILMENLIHTDLVSVDYSNVTNSIEDVDRLSQYTPCVMKALSVTELIRKSEKPIYKRIWKRIEEAGTIFEAGEKMMFDWKKDFIWLSEPALVKGLSQALCSTDPKLKVWIPDAAFAELPLTYFTRKDLESRKRKVIESRSRLICEHGLNWALDRKAESESGSGPASHACKIEKMDDLFDMRNEDASSNLKFTHLAQWVSIGIALSLNVFIAESLVLLRHSKDKI